MASIILYIDVSGLIDVIRSQLYDDLAEQIWVGLKVLVPLETR